MNFFQSISYALQDEEAASEIESPPAAMQPLVEAAQERLRIEPSARSRHERQFQERTAIAKEMSAWLRPVLNDLQAAAYPRHRVYGFVNWINQDHDCPWVLLSGELEYGPRHRGPGADPVDWQSHPQPRIRWSIGRYSNPMGSNGTARAFKEQVSVELLFKHRRPDLLQIHLSDAAADLEACQPRLLDLTKALVRLHP